MSELKKKYLKNTHSVLHILVSRAAVLEMGFLQNLSKINKLLFLFGISPYSLNQKSNNFECSAKTLIYTLVYCLTISITIIYMASVHFLSDGQMFQSTFLILTLLQQATIMIIFYSTMFDLMLNRQKHAKFLNSLVELDRNLERFYINANFDHDLISLHRQNIFVICFFSIVCIINSIIHRNRMQNFEHLWNTMLFFQTISLTLVGFYIRCLAVILYRRCSPIFEKIISYGNDLRDAIDNKERIPELMNCFEAFDEVMDLKKRLSNIFGTQLLLNSAFDFISLTISVYGLLYYQAQNLGILYYYFIAYNFPHIVKCVLLILALDTLANQVHYLFY